jgi:hypothetical protein
VARDVSAADDAEAKAAISAPPKNVIRGLFFDYLAMRFAEALQDYATLHCS